MLQLGYIRCFISIHSAGDYEKKYSHLLGVKKGFRSFNQIQCAPLVRKSAECKRKTTCLFCSYQKYSNFSTWNVFFKFQDWRMKVLGKIFSTKYFLRIEYFGTMYIKTYNTSVGSSIFFSFFENHFQPLSVWIVQAIANMANFACGWFNFH